MPFFYTIHPKPVLTGSRNIAQRTNKSAHRKEHDARTAAGAGKHKEELQMSYTGKEIAQMHKDYVMQS